MKQAGYETVMMIEEHGVRPGKPGKALYHVPWKLKLFLMLLGIYALAAIAFTTFVLLHCPSHGQAYRVLPTGDLKVDQFYSGLALSLIFTPAALAIRRLAYDVALLHPFAVASAVPTEIADLDRLMDPGIVATGWLFRYSVSRASAQALIMAAGAFLVPLGTLLVFPGTYSAPTPGIGVVGVPTQYSGMMTMSIEMGGPIDSFLNTALNMYVGNSIKQMAVLQQLPSRLGPTPTANLTYEDGLTYYGIVTYTWSSGCEYTSEIAFTENTEYTDGSADAWLFNVTMPDGFTCTSLDAYETALCITNITDSASGATTTYYAIMGTQTTTVNFDNVTSGTQAAVTIADGAWISRVACTPSMKWEVSSCTWHNDSVAHCIPAPGQNTTELDVTGLDALEQYISRIPLSLDSEGFYTFGLDTILLSLMFDSHGTETVQYRAPTLQDYDNMYGLVAQSIISVATAGYYGTAEVPTSGSAPKPVYLVRTYMLAIVLAALVICPFLPAGVLLWNLHVHRMPLRRSTFLTIANAVRGPWWDATLVGTCLMQPSELRNTFRGIKVMFGVTVEDERAQQPSCHVGFARRVAPVRDEEVYLGIGRKLKVD